MELFGFSDKTGEYDAAQTINVKTLNPGSTVVWDLKNQQNAEITLTGNITMAAPINWKKGRLVMLEIIQDSIGSRTVAWSTQFVNISTLTLNTTANYSNVLVFKCIDNGKVMLVSNSSSTRS